MDRNALAKQVGELVDAVRGDSRWQRDELSMAILGMLSYGYALAIGRMVMFLDMSDIDAAVRTCLMEHLGVSANWSGGLVAEANASAFGPNHHPGHHELIGVGHSYFGVENRLAVLNNVFANIANYRQHTNNFAE